jgi:ATP diphosphatase
MRAEKLTKRAARINFDWPTPNEVLAKLDEELAELKDAQASGDQDHIAEEMGDILFVMANLARKLKVDPEEALRRANAKFTRRFQYIEAKLAEQNRTVGARRSAAHARRSRALPFSGAACGIDHALILRRHF